MHVQEVCSVPLIIPICLLHVQDARFKQEGRAALESLQNLVRNNDGWTLERSAVSVDTCAKNYSAP